MNEREKAFRRKWDIVTAMCSTAQSNGKNDDWYHMMHVAERLHRLEATLDRLAVDQCEGEYDCEKQIRIENLAEKIIADEIGCKCYTQRDPRGYHIRMYLMDSEGRKWFNSWDGETTGLAW